MEFNEAIKKAMILFLQLAKLQRKKVEVEKEIQEIYDKLEYLKESWLKE